MSGLDKTDPTLHSLAHELVGDLMALSDAELLAEVKAEGLDLVTEAAPLRTKIAAALAQSGKARLTAAKSAVEQARTATFSNVRPLRIPNRGAVLGQFANDDAKLRSRLTMAARNGEGLTEGEVNSILEDLRELGAIDDEGNSV